VTEDEIHKLQLIITGIEEQGATCDVTKWERDFMDSQRERLEQYGERTRISDKQWAIIDRIYDKVIGA
jgi:hypothetical protein